MLNKRSFLQGVAGLPLLYACSNASSSSRNAKKPNIIYICVDDLGTQLNCYGAEDVVSPNFDAFAQESLVFDRAFCQIASCTASRTSILTGLRPDETGLVAADHDWRKRLPRTLSLPQHLRRAGYRTESIGKIWDPRAGDGTRLGWNEQSEEWGISDNDLAIEALNRCVEAGGPFALFVGYRAPHCPWEPSDDALAAYKGREIQPEGAGRTISNDYLQECSGIGRGDLTDEDASDITRRFYASVTEVDALIGDFLTAVKELDLYDNSVIVLWSGDHGYHLGSQDHWGKWRNDVASTRVPLMMRIPGQSHLGHRTSAMVEGVDMMPTLLDLAGVQVEGLHGDSLLPLFEDPQRDWKSAAFSIWWRGDDAPTAESGRSVKTTDWHYIEFASGEKRLTKYGIGPNETFVDIADAPEKYAEMSALLEQGWQKARPLR